MITTRLFYKQKKNYKINFFTILFLVGFYLLFTNKLTFASETIKVIDAANREVTVKKNVKRIVALGPGTLRLITYLNAVDLLVGIENLEKNNSSIIRPYSFAIKEKIRDLPVVSEGGPGKLPDPESIIAVNPDVVFTFGIDISQINTLQEKTKVPFIVIQTSSLGSFTEETINALILISRIINKEERARTIINYIENLRNQLQDRTKHITKKPRVYAGGLGYKGIQGITSTDTNFPPFTYLNAYNLASNLKKLGHVFIDKELLLKWQPDYIFVDVNSFPLLREDLKKDPTFYKSITAFKDNAYSIISYNSYNTNLELLFINTFFIGKVLYPELFSDVDLKEKTNEISNFFLGISIYDELVKEGKIFGKIQLINDEITIKRLF